MSTAAVTGLARNAWNDLREKRLWPLALVLLAAMVGVPALLLHSAPPAPGPVPVAATGAAPSGIPAVSVQSSPGQAKLPGYGRDPFGQPPSGAPVTGSATGTAPSTGTATAGAAGGNSSTTSATTGSGSATTTPATAVSGPVPVGGAPPPPVPTRKPAPAPSGLSPLQSYSVAISITNAAGGVNLLDPLQRLSLLPSPRQPLLVELGVLQGGHRVLFAVPPGTVLRGPGTCIPGPIDCEILSLGEDQIESLSTGANSGAAAMFAITGIAATDHPSAAAAQQVRQSVSAEGERFVATLSVPALSLFQYAPRVGAVVDLRNLTLGES
ncbi:MAG TPA: hypothetical protein VMU90_09240 [Solirubrobacteraceae bacterium]|nr:hypothetical protein [Solirubrobacteraceae bacterium]